MMQSFQMIVLLCTCSVTSGITFEYRIRCPDSPEKWRENSDSYICDGDSVYHCMQNTEGRYVVFCASSIWIQPDYCPEFNSRTSAIDVILCPGDHDSCPETVYLSTAVYQFPSCYRPESSFRTSTPSPTTTWYPSTSTSGSHFPKVPDEKNRSSFLVVVSILMGVITPFALLCPVVVFYFKHRKKETSKAALNSEHFLPSNTEEQTSLLEQKHDGRTENRKSAEDEEKPSSDIKHTPSSSEVLFWKPKDYNAIVDAIKREGLVFLVGISGSGKTTLAKYLANTEFKEYKIIFKKPKERIEPEENTLILWGDCFGVWNTTNRIDDQLFETLVRLIEQVKHNPDRMKAIVCIDSSSVEENQLNQLKVCVVNVDKSYESQLDKEKFRNALKLEFTIRTVSSDVGFPLLIHLIKTGFCAGESYSRFLEEPVAYIRDDIDGILKEQSDDYITLIYALFHNSAIHVKEVNEKLWGKIRKECHRIPNKKN